MKSKRLGRGGGGDGSKNRQRLVVYSVRRLFGSCLAAAWLHIYLWAYACGIPADKICLSMGRGRSGTLGKGNAAGVQHSPYIHCKILPTVMSQSIMAVFLAVADVLLWALAVPRLLLLLSGTTVFICLSSSTHTLPPSLPSPRRPTRLSPFPLSLQQDTEAVSRRESRANELRVKQMDAASYEERLQQVRRE